MREIKFRGKTEIHFPDNKGNVVIPKDKWIYGGIVYDTDRIWIDTPYYGQIIVNKDTIGQYTGLHDKNGKEIYEGDIIQYEDITKGLVRYSEKYAQYVLVNTGSVKDEFEPLGDYNIEVFEIIGNEYDNPELLEKGE